MTVERQYKNAGLYWQNELRKANERIAQLEHERLELLAETDRLDAEIRELSNKIANRPGGNP